MKCPNCKEEITQVNVISECLQKADIDVHGEITNFGSVEEIFDAQRIECPSCLTEIRKQ